MPPRFLYEKASQSAALFLLADSRSVSCFETDLVVGADNGRPGPIEKKARECLEAAVQG